jgi:VanZ family protein
VLKNLFFWIAFSWTLVVAYFCLVPSSDIPSISIPHLDKLAHSFFHFVFTILWFLFFKKQVKKRNQTKLLVGSVIFSLFFGIVIEVLQVRLTTTRNGDFFDVLANLSGAVSAFVFVLIAKQIKKNPSYHT